MHVEKFSIRTPKSKPSAVIKTAVIDLAREAGYRLNTLAKILEYCDYEPRIGFKITTFDHTAPEVSKILQNGGDIDIEPHILNSLMEIPVDGHNFFDINLADNYISTIVLELLLGLLENEKTLKKRKLLKNIKILVQPRNSRSFIEIEKASSGELTLIASQVFILSKIREKTVVLIDEPENSLHPQWQKDYVNRLGDLISRYNPEVYIATHSPLIVSGVRHSEDIIQFYYAESGVTTHPEKNVPSAEESLWEQFDTITPESRYVSDHIVDLLENLDNYSQTFDEVMRQLNQMEEASYDHQQREVLRAAKELAKKINQEKLHG
jgi:predicted ATP-dependent endonuclease of OLD family